jgi:hypothetical protein
MSRQSFRKLVANLAVLVALAVCLFFVSSPQAAWGSVFWGQGHQKTITRHIEKNQPLRFDKVRTAGRALELKGGDESEENFDADDDWMKGLAVTFKNTTEKNIVYFRLDLMFPETAGQEPMRAYHMIFGRRPKDSTDKDYDKVLKPGEEVEIALNDESYGKMRAFLKKGSFDKVSSVRLFLETAIFDDDLMWNGGSFYRRDEKDPNNWLPVR